MSLIKQSLPEDVDVTDERETGFYGEPQEPSHSDWAVSELINAIGTLEKFGAVGYVRELKTARARLQAIIDETVKPF